MINTLIEFYSLEEVLIKTPDIREQFINTATIPFNYNSSLTITTLIDMLDEALHLKIISDDKYNKIKKYAENEQTCMLAKELFYKTLNEWQESSHN